MELEGRSLRFCSSSLTYPAVLAGRLLIMRKRNYYCESLLLL